MNLSRALLFAGLAGPALARVGHDDNINRILLFKNKGKPTGNGKDNTGNGFDKGGHDYQLLLVCVQKTDNKEAIEDHFSNRKTILVDCAKKSKINLLNSDENSDCPCRNGYCITDAVADGGNNAAEFCLPDPFDGDTAEGNQDEKAKYKILARVVGQPGGSANLELCATDPRTGEVVCYSNVGNLITLTTGSKAQDISQQLLTICYDVDDDGKADEGVGLFDDNLEDYFWDYETYGANNGGQSKVRVAQLRFYATTDGVQRKNAC